MSTAPTHDELLAAHAAGRLPPPVALVVATHLALSPQARRRYRCFEAAGGALLDRIEPAPLASDAWERCRARLDEGGAGEPTRPEPRPAPAGRGDPTIPRPLRDHLPVAPDELRWRRSGNASAVDLDLGTIGDYRTTLIRVCAGTEFPRHGHGGLELILTLAGGFRDESGRYLRGDLQIADPETEHQPVAEPGEDWLWLRVLDAPLRLSGPLGRLKGRIWRF
jgi:putative transcriptional regulator